jgi:hypothetical protein
LRELRRIPYNLIESTNGGQAKNHDCFPSDQHLEPGMAIQPDLDHRRCKLYLLSGPLE